MSNIGNELERDLGALHLQLRAARQAVMLHVPTPGAVAGAGGTKRHKAPPLWVDFIGSARLPDGEWRPVAIEAKARSEDVLCHSVLSSHQAATLREVDALGWVSVVYARLLKDESEPARWVDLVVPYRVLLLERSVGADDRRWRVRAGRSWLDAAREWERYTRGGGL